MKKEYEFLQDNPAGRAIYYRAPEYLPEISKYGRVTQESPPDIWRLIVTSGNFDEVSRSVWNILEMKTPTAPA